MCDPYDKTFPTVPWILSMWPWAWPLTYFWKNFNIGHNFFIIRDRAFILGMCVPYDKTFPSEPWILNMWPWPWPLAYFWKTLTLAITFLSFEIKISYLACVFLMTRPFQWYHKFWTCDPDRDLLPTFEKLNIGYNFFILWDKAFIFGMSVLYDEAFSIVP